MIESSFLVVAVVLVVAALLVLVVQTRKGLAESSPVEVSRRARTVPVAVFCVFFLVQAVRAVLDGHEVLAVVATVGSIGAAVRVAYIYRILPRTRSAPPD